MTIRMLMMAGAALLLSLPAYAANDAPPPAAENPYLKKIEKMTEDLGKQLDEPALKHLYYIREGFGATRVVQMVRKDVGEAVKACGKDNPDMKTAIDDQFSSWTKAVDPVVKEKQVLMEKAIAEQTYAKPKEIKDYLKLIEQAGEYANKQIDKQIVTTPEACESLRGSMVETQDVVSKLLSEVQFLVWPVPADAKIKSGITKAP